MEREQTGLSGLLLVLSGCYLVLSACSEDEGEWNGSNAGEGNGRFNASYSQARKGRVLHVRSIEVVAGQRTTRYHWPIFVFTGYFSRVDIFSATHKPAREATLRVNM